jgi:hypothetical protein
MYCDRLCYRSPRSSCAKSSRSFRLNRTLEAQEQLDLSVTNDYGTWYANKDQLIVEYGETPPSSLTVRSNPGLDFERRGKCLE